MKFASSLSSVVFVSILVWMNNAVANGEVVELTDDNFEHQTQASTGQTTGKWFVKFYAPWCGHCVSLAPTWEDLAAKVAEENPADGIVIAKVDVTQNSDIAKRFQIQGFPTLKYLADRKMYKYSGGRNLDELHAFVTDGYKETGVLEDIPAPPSWLQMKLKALDDNSWIKTTMADFDDILNFRKNAAAVMLGMGFVFGVLIGLILGMSMASSSSGGSAAKSKKE